jgi:hypothetical protein
MSKAIQDSLNSLKGTEENIAGYDKLIELSSNPQDKRKYAEYKKKRILDRNREIAFLQMLLATKPFVNATAAEIGREIESLK